MTTWETRFLRMRSRSGEEHRMESKEPHLRRTTVPVSSDANRRGSFIKISETLERRSEQNKSSGNPRGARSIVTRIEDPTGAETFPGSRRTAERRLVLRS